MTEAVYDFPAINRRLMRKPDPVAAMAPDYRRELIDEPAMIEFRRAIDAIFIDHCLGTSS